MSKSKKDAVKEFKEKHGVKYHGFRMWLKKEHLTNIKTVKLTGEYDKMLEDYKASRMSFEDRYNVSYIGFRTWASRNVEGYLSDLTPEEYDELAKKYAQASQLKHTPKKQYRDILHKYIFYVEEGVRLELDSDELKIVNTLLNE